MCNQILNCNFEQMSEIGKKNQQQPPPSKYPYVKFTKECNQKWCHDFWILGQNKAIKMAWS